MSDRPTPEQIISNLTMRGITGDDVLDQLDEAGYVIVHPDDVLDWIERLSENPLGTPIYTDYTPGEALDSFMERFAERETPLQRASREVTEQQDTAAEQEPDLPFRIAVRHDDETWSYTEGEPIDIAAADQEPTS